MKLSDGAFNHELYRKYEFFPRPFKYNVFSVSLHKYEIKKPVGIQI